MSNNNSTYTDGVAELAGQTIQIEFARTIDEKLLGLSNREAIGENEGMLFEFKPATIPSFWMKDMKFDIDIVWIKDNQAIDISKSVPAQPGVADTELPLYSPKSAVDRVLELKSGWSDRHNLKVGDEVRLNLKP